MEFPVKTLWGHGEISLHRRYETPQMYVSLMVGAEGADQSINVEFDRIGAFIADSQKGVTGLDVG